MAMGRTARLLAAIVLAAAASACGGGGGGGDDGGVVGGPQNGSFSAADPTPPAGTMSLQQGTRTGLVVNVLVSATNVNDFFGAGVRLDYDPTTVRFESSDTATSFLRDPPFGGPGAALQFQVDGSTPGSVMVSAARLQNLQGTATGVNVVGTRTLVSLQFRLLVATNGSPVNLPSAQREVRDSQDAVLALPWFSGAFVAN
jgi:hypothetical protein